MNITSQLMENKKQKQEICKVFSKRFKKLRENRCLTLVDIAAKLGVSRQSIVYYAMGDRIPSIVVLFQLSELLGSSIDYLVGRTNKLI